MTANELDQLLTTLRKHGVASAEVPGPEGAAGVLRVVFGPEGSLPAGIEQTPGGWKSPGGLDQDPLEDERSVP